MMPHKAYPRLVTLLKKNSFFFKDIVKQYQVTHLLKWGNGSVIWISIQGNGKVLKDYFLKYLKVQIF